MPFKRVGAMTISDHHVRSPLLNDFVEAGNTMGFHAPQEAMRLPGLSIDYTRQGQRA